MKFKNFDLFSSQFKLNISKDQPNKRSCFGGFLSIAVIIISMLYFAYLTFQYISNQIEPKYKTQTFLTEDQIQIGFENNFIGFSYFVNNNTTLQMLEQQTNKIYFVYQSYLLIQDSVDSQIIEIPNFKCTSEKLLGYRCFDVSNLKQKYLQLNAQENSKINLILTMSIVHIQIQYPTFLEVLAIFYSALSVLLGIGAIARYYSKKVIIQDVSLIMLQNLYQKTYLELLGSKNLVNQHKIEEESIVLEEDILENQIQAFPVSKVKGQQNPNAKQQTTEDINTQFLLANTQRSSKVMLQIDLTDDKKALKKCRNFKKSQSLYVAHNPAKQKKIIKKIQLNLKKENKDKVDSKKDEAILIADVIQQSPQFYSQKSILSGKNSQINFFKQNQQSTKDKIQQNCDQINLINQKDQIYSLIQLSSNNKFNENQNQDIKFSEPVSLKKLDQAATINKLVLINKKQLYSQTDSKIHLQTTSRKDLSIDEKINTKNVTSSQELSNFSHLQNENLSKRLRKRIFSYKWCLGRKQVNPNQSDQGKYKKLQTELLNQINEQLNVVAMYKDLIFLKKSVMMMLTTDQLAAIQLTGTQLNLESAKSDIHLTSNQRQSHLERQLQIQECKKQQQFQFKYFLDRIKLKQNITETDRRILSSLSQQAINLMISVLALILNSVLVIAQFVPYYDINIQGIQTVQEQTVQIQDSCSNQNGCKTCQLNGNCQVCQQGYFLYQSQSSVICLLCPQFNLLQPDQIQCAECIQDPNNWSQYRSCSISYNRIKINQQQTVIESFDKVYVDKSDLFVQVYHIDQTNFKIQYTDYILNYCYNTSSVSQDPDCIQNVISNPDIVEKYIKLKAGYSLVQTNQLQKIIKCPLNCAQCSQDSNQNIQCLKCNGGYAINQSYQCVLCSSLIPNCQQCYYGSNLLNLNLQPQLWSQYQTSQQMQSAGISLRCNFCQSQDIYCKICNQPFFLSYTGQSCDTCDIPNCQKCYYGDQQGTGEFYTLSNQKCDMQVPLTLKKCISFYYTFVNGTQIAQCSKCQDGYTPSPLNGCIRCDNAIDQYSTGYENPFICKQCNIYYQNGQDFNIQVVLNNPFYDQNNYNSTSEQLVLPPFCQSCTSQLKTGVCVDQNGQTCTTDCLQVPQQSVNKCSNQFNKPSQCSSCVQKSKQITSQYNIKKIYSVQVFQTINQQNNQCVECSRYCQVCQERTSQEIYQMNPYFQSNDNFKQFTNKCLLCKTPDQLCKYGFKFGGQNYKCDANQKPLDNLQVYFDANIQSCTVCPSTNPQCRKKITFVRVIECRSQYDSTYVHDQSQYLTNMKVDLSNIFIGNINPGVILIKEVNTVDKLRVDFDYYDSFKYQQEIIQVLNEENVSEINFDILVIQDQDQSIQFQDGTQIKKFCILPNQIQFETKIAQSIMNFNKIQIQFKSLNPKNGAVGKENLKFITQNEMVFQGFQTIKLANIQFYSVAAIQTSQQSQIIQTTLKIHLGSTLFNCTFEMKNVQFISGLQQQQIQAIANSQNQYLNIEFDLQQVNKLVIQDLLIQGQAISNTKMFNLLSDTQNYKNIKFISIQNLMLLNSWMTNSILFQIQAIQGSLFADQFNIKGNTFQSSTLLNKIDSINSSIQSQQLNQQFQVTIQNSQVSQNIFKQSYLTNFSNVQQFTSNKLNIVNQYQIVNCAGLISSNTFSFTSFTFSNPNIWFNPDQYLFQNSSIFSFTQSNGSQPISYSASFQTIQLQDSIFQQSFAIFNLTGSSQQLISQVNFQNIIVQGLKINNADSKIIPTFILIKNAQSVTIDKSTVQNNFKLNYFMIQNVYIFQITNCQFLGNFATNQIQTTSNDGFGFYIRNVKIRGVIVNVSFKNMNFYQPALYIEGSQVDQQFINYDQSLIKQDQYQLQIAQIQQKIQSLPNANTDYFNLPTLLLSQLNFINISFSKTNQITDNTGILQFSSNYPIQTYFFDIIFNYINNLFANSDYYLASCIEIHSENSLFYFQNLQMKYINSQSGPTLNIQSDQLFMFQTQFTNLNYALTIPQNAINEVRFIRASLKSLYHEQVNFQNAYCSYGCAIAVNALLDFTLTINKSQFHNLKTSIQAQGEGGALYVNSFSSTSINLMINQIDVLNVYSTYQGGFLQFISRSIPSTIQIQYSHFHNVFSVTGGFVRAPFQKDDNKMSLIGNTFQSDFTESLNFIKQYINNNQFQLNARIQQELLTFSYIFQQYGNLIFQQNQILNFQQSARFLKMTYGILSMTKDTFQSLKIYLKTFFDTQYTQITFNQLTMKQIQYIKDDSKVNKQIKFIQQYYKSVFYSPRKCIFSFQNTNDPINLSQLIFDNIICQDCSSGIFYVAYSKSLILSQSVIQGIVNSYSIINISSQDDSSKCALASNKFLKNKSLFDCSVIALTNLNIEIDDSIFEYNQSYGVGGAVCIYYQQQFTSVPTFKNTIISNNKANIGGGMYLYGTSFNMLMNTQIAKNKALLHSDNIFSTPRSLLPYKVNQESGQLQPLKQNNQGYYEINDWEPSQINKKDYILIRLIDQDNAFMIPDQKDPVSSNMPAIISLDTTMIGQSQTSQAVTGQTNELFNFNVESFTFKKIVFQSAPGSTIYVVVQYANVMIPMYDESGNFLQFDTSYQLKLKINLRKCVAGEQYQETLQQCILCQENSYSLLPYSTQCMKCNFEYMQECPGGNQIVMNQGYWRTNSTTDIIFKCDKSYNSCIGGSGGGDDLCSEGRVGPLCGSCDIYGEKWGQQYFNIDTDVCGKCSEIQYSYIKFTIFSIAMITFLFIQSLSYFNYSNDLAFLKFLSLFNPQLTHSITKNKQQSGIAIKILINYIQLILFLRSFDIQIPIQFSVFASSLGQPIQQAVFSLDCFIVNNMRISEFVYSRLVYASMIPLFYLVILVILMTIYFKVFKNKILDISTISVSIIYLFISLQPSLVTQLIQVLSCREIGGSFYISSNLQFECYTPIFYRWVYLYVVPVLATQTIIIPLLIFQYLYRYKEKLSSIKMMKRLGFLYYEFKKKCYYWQFVSIFQKILIIILLNVFDQYETIKGTLFLVIMYSYSIIQRKVQPYEELKYNRLDSKCTSTIMFSLILVIFLYQNPLYVLCLLASILLITINVIFSIQLILEVIRGSLQLLFYRCDDFIRKAALKFPKLFKFLKISPVSKKRVFELWRILRQKIIQKVKAKRSKRELKKINQQLSKLQIEKTNSELETPQNVKKRDSSRRCTTQCFNYFPSSFKDTYRQQLMINTPKELLQSNLIIESGEISVKEKQSTEVQEVPKTFAQFLQKHQKSSSKNYVAIDTNISENHNNIVIGSFKNQPSSILQSLDKYQSSLSEVESQISSQKKLNINYQKNNLYELGGLIHGDIVAPVQEEQNESKTTVRQQVENIEINI
ncbi:hypothetical protein ABPG74_000939 [Tetrahymena malaccensis]